MKRIFTYIIISVFLLATIFASVWNSGDSKNKFRFLGGGESGYYASYTFQSPPEEKIFAGDCFGCEEEVGNVDIYRESKSPEQTRYLFDSNSENELLEKGEKFNSNGIKIGERAITVFRKDGKIADARIFWTEGNDFWFVQAPTLELAKELERSDLFQCVRKKRKSELIRKYCYSE